MNGLLGVEGGGALQFAHVRSFGYDPIVLLGNRALSAGCVTGPSRGFA